MMTCNLISIYRSVLRRILKYCKIIFHQQICKKFKCRIPKYCKISFINSSVRTSNVGYQSILKLSPISTSLRTSNVGYQNIVKLFFINTSVRTHNVGYQNIVKLSPNQHLCHNEQCRIVVFIAIYDHRRLKHRGPMIVYSCVFRCKWVNSTKSPASCVR